MMIFQGAFFDPEKMSPEDVKNKWDDITNFERNNDYPQRPDDTFSKIMEYRDTIKAKL